MYYLCRTPMPEFKTCGLKQFDADERHVTRVFKESVLILMLDGVLRFTENGETVELSRGEYYIQRAGLTQSGRVRCESPLYFFIHMNAAFSRNAEEGIPIRGKFSEAAIRGLMEEYDRRYLAHTNSFFAVNGLLYEILAELENNAPPENAKVRIARDIRRFIGSEYRSNISLSRIAARYGYSEDYTIRLFKSEYGITPYQYLIQKRLQEAEHLLLTTATSVEEISRTVGYNDFSTFYRDFRKRFGMSPSEKRAMAGTDA